MDFKLKSLFKLIYQLFGKYANIYCINQENTPFVQTFRKEVRKGYCDNGCQYSFALGTIMNHELLASYSAQISIAGAFSEKITRFLIDRKWLEKGPGTYPRKTFKNKIAQ